MNEVKSKKRGGISPMWLVPLLAALVAIWLVVKVRSERGPEIVVLFEQAEGLEQGKTPVYFRGVKVGVVRNLRILPDYRSVAAKIQLEKFAAGLAKEGSTFWIEKPVMSFSQGITGLNTLISGNYIVAEVGSGPEKFEFEGLKKIPPAMEMEDHFSIRIQAREVRHVQEAEPIYFRGVKIGLVDRHELEPKSNQVMIYADIRQEFRHLIQEGARFWFTPLVAISAGPGVVDLDIQSPGTLLKGGIEMDYFGSGSGGTQAEENSLFQFYPSEEMARCTGTSFEVFFENGQGLLPEKTMVRYRGYPVGMVQTVEPQLAQNRVRVKAQLFEGYEGLLKNETAFWLVRPVINLQGAQGLETIFSGVYLECRPGTGRAKTVFQGMESQPFRSVEGPGNARYVLQAEHTALPLHAPLFYRGVEVGRVVGKELSADARRAYVTVEIAAEYRPIIRQNTKFFNVSGLEAYFGFLGIKVQAESLETIAAGGLALATPEGPQMGGPAQRGSNF